MDERGSQLTSVTETNGKHGGILGDLARANALSFGTGSCLSYSKTVPSRAHFSQNFEKASQGDLLINDNK